MKSKLDKCRLAVAVGAGIGAAILVFWHGFSSTEYIEKSSISDRFLEFPAHRKLDLGRVAETDTFIKYTAYPGSKWLETQLNPVDLVFGRFEATSLESDDADESSTYNGAMITNQISDRITAIIFDTSPDNQDLTIGSQSVLYQIKALVDQTLRPKSICIVTHRSSVLAKKSQSILKAFINDIPDNSTDIRVYTTGHRDVELGWRGVDVTDGNVLILQPGVIPERQFLRLGVHCTQTPNWTIPF